MNPRPPRFMFALDRPLKDKLDRLRAKFGLRSMADAVRKLIEDASA